MFKSFTTPMPKSHRQAHIQSVSFPDARAAAQFAEDQDALDIRLKAETHGVMYELAATLLWKTPLVLLVRNLHKPRFFGQPLLRKDALRDPFETTEVLVSAGAASKAPTAPREQAVAVDAFEAWKRGKAAPAAAPEARGISMH